MDYIKKSPWPTSWEAIVETRACELPQRFLLRQDIWVIKWANEWERAISLVLQQPLLADVRHWKDSKWLRMAPAFKLLKMLGRKGEGREQVSVNTTHMNIISISNKQRKNKLGQLAGLAQMQWADAKENFLENRIAKLARKKKAFEREGMAWAKAPKHEIQCMEGGTYNS